eukprot:946182-Prymnesium_polylepis.2
MTSGSPRSSGRQETRLIRRPSSASSQARTPSFTRSGCFSTYGGGPQTRAAASFVHSEPRGSAAARYRSTPA